jgi:hypothetical protein
LSGEFSVVATQSLLELLKDPSERKQKKGEAIEGLTL